MFRFVSTAGNKIMEKLEDFGYFDEDEISRINEKYIPGLELQLSSNIFKEYDFNSVTPTYSKKVGILYKLKYGEIGARVVWKSSPIAQFTGTLRVLNDIAGFEITSMGAFDIHGHRLDKWNAGLTFIGGNTGWHLKLDADKLVFTTRHKFQPGLAVLTQFDSPFIDTALRSTYACGLEWELNSRTTLEVMCSDLHPPVFALQYQFSRPHCLVRFSGDVYSKSTGVSFAFSPSSFF